MQSVRRAALTGGVEVRNASHTDIHALTHMRHSGLECAALGAP